MNGYIVGALGAAAYFTSANVQALNFYDFLLRPIVIEPPVEEILSYDCGDIDCKPTLNSPLYVPGCAGVNGGFSCSFMPNETIATVIKVENYAVAIGMDVANSSHKRWEVSVGEPGNFNVAPECYDISYSGRDMPRINFQPRYLNGCPQPDGDSFILNVRPWGNYADNCGTNFYRCAVIVYGP